MSRLVPPTIRTGLVGASIQRSLSPMLHVAEGEALGLRNTYELFDLDVLGPSATLEQVLQRAEKDGFAGLNVTHPCKQTVMPLLHTLSDEAKAIGAVNTVVFRDGLRIGHNTDWYGFSESLKRGLPDASLGVVVQLGAGGAGAAVAYALLRDGARQVIMFDVDRQRAQALTERFAQIFGADRIVVGEDIPGALRTADGLVNCTPIGMLKYPGTPLPAALLCGRLWVADIVYVPLQTELLNAAGAAGCRTLGGGGMVVIQAAMSLELFTGVTPNTRRMLDSFNRYVQTGLAA